MKLLAIFFSLAALFPLHLAAQPWSAGAKSRALANTNLFLEDAWAVCNQPAALGFREKPGAGIWAERRFGLKELTTGAVATALPLRKGSGGTIGLGSYIDGGSVYLKTYVHTLSYGLKLTPSLSAGAGMHIVQFLSVEPYQRTSKLSTDFGIIYKSSKTAAGFHIWNLVPPKITANPQERLPCVYRAGLSHQLSKKLQLLGEVHHELNVSTGIKAAIRYRPSEILALYGGFNSSPASFAFGVSLFHKNLSLDLSFGIYNRLGNTPGISIEYGEQAKP